MSLTILPGDLKLGNIMIPMEDMSLLDVVANDEAIAPSPRKIAGDREIYLSRNDFGPFRDGKIPGPPRIMDFDCAVRGDGVEPLTHDIQPADFQAPEVILGIPWTYSADIWNVGLMVSSRFFLWRFLCLAYVDMEFARGPACVFYCRSRAWEAYPEGAHCGFDCAFGSSAKGILASWTGYERLFQL